MSVLELFLLEIFRNSFYCHLLFNYQCPLLSRDSLIRLSQPICPCQQLFLSFLFFLKLVHFSGVPKQNITLHFYLSILFFAFILIIFLLFSCTSKYSIWVSFLINICYMKPSYYFMLSCFKIFTLQNIISYIILGGETHDYF